MLSFFNHDSLAPPDVSAILKSGTKPQLEEAEKKAINKHIPKEIMYFIAQKAELIACNKWKDGFETIYQLKEPEGSLHSIKLKVFADYDTAFITVSQKFNTEAPENPKFSYRGVSFTMHEIKWKKGHCQHNGYQNYTIGSKSLPENIVDALYIECFKKQLVNIDDADLDLRHFIEQALAEFVRDNKLDPNQLSKDSYIVQVLSKALKSAEQITSTPRFG